MKHAHNTPHGLEVGPRHRALLTSTLGLLWLTGFLWVVLHYGPEALRAWEDSHSLKPVAIKIHGAAAWVYLGVLGALVPLHMRRGWVKNHGRRSGGALISMVGFVVLTGWILTYAGGEGIRQGSHWVHVILGLGLPAALWAHIAWERRK